MVGSNKILTVSYGTFSCTLEGFEESFDTMKGIAEYFRDLAADDRYFGAEPPTPDAEMLARIAEREISRRVEARMESSGLVLRATGSLAKPEPELAERPMPPAQPARTIPVASEPVAEPMVDLDAAEGLNGEEEYDDFVSGTEATAPVRGDVTGSGASVLAASGPATAPIWPQPEPAAADRPAAVAKTVVPAHPDTESVAAKLQRIRSVVGKASAAATVTDYAEDLNVADFTAPMVQAPAPVEDDQDDASFLSSVLSRTEMAEADTIAESVVPAAEAAEDEDFDLGAIQTAVATPQDSVEDDEDNLEALDLSSFDADDIDSDDDMLSDEDDADAATGEIVDEDDYDDLDLSDLIGDEGIASGEAQEDLAEEALADEDLVDDSDDDEDLDTIAPAAMPVRARVIRMKRSEFDAAIASGALVEDDDSETADVTNVAALDGLYDIEGLEAEAAVEPTLDSDLEAALQQELAEVEREFAAQPHVAPVVDEDEEDFDDEDYDDLDEDFDDLDEDEEEQRAPFNLMREDMVAAPSEAAVRPARPGRALLDREPDADEAAMSRILSETDAQLNEPESNRRRAAIAQLKAAVAATEAARRLGEDRQESDKPEEAFRDDLSQVVRPRRAALQPERKTERPRPAPLKLVASQRIDAETKPDNGAAVSPVRPVMPVRPRRVSTDETPAAQAPVTMPASAVPSVAPIAARSSSFSEFAEEVGARDLGELLEAAAAYTSFVEGLQDFSRPQIMKKVREVTTEDFSREDSLRSFGTLLRQGRIEKVRNGRFQVSKQTRYRPEPRVARG
jgi:hypothetical protein